MSENTITSQTRDIQMAILKIAKEIHRICEENSIPYFMLGGTLIGAVRHKGFIPWDDDLDIGLLYSDYLRLIDILNNQNHPWLTIDTPSSDGDYPLFFTKVYDKNTTLIENKKSNRPRGVFVDIFPMVYIGNTKEEGVKRYKTAKFWRILQMEKSGLHYSHGIAKDICFSVLSKIFSRPYIFNKGMSIPNKTINTRLEYSVLIDGHPKDVTPTRLYESLRLFDFEDTQLYGMVDYDEFLTLVFGDYMKLPPEEKRIPEHFEYVNLNLPYEDYIVNNHLNLK